MKILGIIDYDTFRDDYLEIASSAAPYAEMLWLRFKNTDSATVFKMAWRMRQILPVTRLILSERADIAVAAGFNGVQLNKWSTPVNVIKETFPQLSVGYSAHSVEECLNIKADFFTLSPIFDTSKYENTKPLGIINAPTQNVYALGGINVNNYQLLYGRGFAGIGGIRLVKDIRSFK